MKNFISKAVLIAFIASLASCSSSDILVSKEKQVEFQRIGETEILDMANAVSEIYENYQQATSRSTDPLESATELAQTEQQIAKQCERLTEEGIQVRNQLVQIKQEEPEALSITEEEFEAILDMTDDQLALCALALNTIAEQEFTVQTEERQIVSNLYANCMLEAIGVNDIVDFVGFGAGVLTGTSVSAIIKGTKALITAQTAKKTSFVTCSKICGMDWCRIYII